MISRKSVEEKRQALLVQREQLVADLHAVDGALQIVGQLIEEDTQLAAAEAKSSAAPVAPALDILDPHAT